MPSPLRARHAALLALALLGSLPAVAAGSFDALILPFKEVVVAAPVQSRIDEIDFEEGDTVKAGDVLARLYARIEELDMERAKTALEKKEFDYKSSKNLYTDKIISEDDALKDKIELDLARLQYQQATEIFEQRTLRSPIDGLVVDRLREVGESVSATQPMFRLVDISQVYVQFYVHAAESTTMKVGDVVTVTCPGTGIEGRFTGKIAFIDPRVDAASGLMRVKVLVPNHDRLIKPGLRAQVTPGAP